MYLPAASAPVPIAAIPAATPVETRLATLTMELSCLDEVLTLFPSDLSTLPAIFMASSMTLLFGILNHHPGHIVQFVQRQGQKVVHAAVQLERKCNAPFFDLRRGYSSPSPPYRKEVTRFFSLMASFAGSRWKNSTGLPDARAAM